MQSFDPGSRRVTWEYSGPKQEPLFSLRSGGAEILPNGNVLIVETDRGRGLEIQPSQEIAWAFHNPFRVGEKRDRVADLYTLERVPLQNWLAGTRPHGRK